MHRGPDNTQQFARSLLGLGDDPTRDEIDRAFRSAARRHHPDRGGDPAEFRSLIGAREALLDTSDTNVGRSSPIPNPVVVVPRRRWAEVIAEIIGAIRPPPDRPPRVR